MKFQMILKKIFNEVPYQTQVCQLMRSNNGSILVPTYFHTPRDARRLIAYQDGNPLEILKNIFLLLSSHLIPKGGTIYALNILITLERLSKTA